MFDPALRAPQKTDCRKGAITPLFAILLPVLLVLCGFTLAGYPILRSPTALLCPFAVILIGALFACIGQLFTSGADLIKDVDKRGNGRFVRSFCIVLSATK